MSIILSHTRDTLPAYPSLSPRSLAHLDILIYLYILISAYTYLYLLQQTLRFSFDRSLADFHSDFLSFPSNFPFTTWTVFPFCFLVFVHRHHTRIHLFSSRFVLVIVVVTLFLSLFLSLALSVYPFG